MLLYYFGVIACFSFSTIFHTFSDHSYFVHRVSNDFDHLGILLVMWCTGISGTHFALRGACSNYRLHCITFLTAATGLCATLILRPPFRQRRRFRAARSLVYCCLGASLFAPFIVAWLSLGSLDELERDAGLSSFISLATVNSIGGVLYAARVPERWFPGRVDCLGHGHNWMHMLVLLGAKIRLNGLLEVYRRWELGGGTISYCPNRV